MNQRGWLRLISVLVVAVGAVILARPVAHWFETPRPLSKLLQLVHEAKREPSQQNLAERELRLYLSHHPDSREANMMMANLLIDRNNPKPEEALAHLDRLRSRDLKTRAAVLVARGKAHYILSRFRQSEAEWKEAMSLDPEVPEAGWLLIQQYYIQGRNDLCRELAIRLASVESDPVDRVRYMLELVREEVERLAPAGIIPWLEPAVKLDPDDWDSMVALGRAQVKEGQSTAGFALLKRAVERRPDDLRGWDYLLGGLSDEGSLEELERQLSRLPAALANDSRLAIHRGRLAQERQQFDEAVKWYRVSLEAYPNDQRLLHRLARVLHLASRPTEARPYEEREAALAVAARELKAHYEKVKSAKTAPVARDFQTFAAIRERQGLREEALGWHRLVLRDDPENVESRLALARLERGNALSASQPES